MSDDLRPTNSRTGEVQDTPLVDDLAEVLTHMVAGWKIPPLAEHPEVVRVMARYRASKERVDPLVAEALYVFGLRNDIEYHGGQELAEMVLERFGVKG